MLHRDIEKRQRDIKVKMRRDGQKEDTEKERKKATQKGQKEMEITRKRKGEKLQTTQRTFYLFLFHFFKEMRKRYNSR